MGGGAAGMSMIRAGVRQTMAWLHGWAGLFLGWVLFVMCLAGTLSVFKPEIGRWMRPEATARADAVPALVAATEWLRHDAAKSHGWYLTAPDARMNTVDATYDPGTGWVVRALDPATGRPVARETIGGEFFYRLHFELQLPYPWGRLLASAAAMAMLVALITGIIAHRRIFRDFFTFRPAKGQRSWLDGHNALGVLSLPFHLMITFTGLVTLASLTMPWGIVANYGQDMATMFQEFTPGSVDREETHRAAPLAPVAPMLAEAVRRFGGAPIGRVSVNHPGDSSSTVTVFRSDAGQLAYAPGEISFDGATGRVLADWTEQRPALKAYGVVYGLHMGRFAPGLMRWLYFLGGTMLTLAIASGLVLWIAKRREKAPLSLGNRIVERLNAGVIAGTPVAFMAYFWANRLLPLGLAGRADAEVSAALWTGAAALAAGLALPPRLSWPVLLGAGALACAGAPLLDDGVALFLDAVARGDGAIVGGDLMMLASALLLGGCARLTLRRKQERRPARAPLMERAA